MEAILLAYVLAAHLKYDQSLHTVLLKKWATAHNFQYWNDYFGQYTQLWRRWATKAQTNLRHMHRFVRAFAAYAQKVDT